MACYQPLTCWRVADRSSGLISISFHPNLGTHEVLQVLQIPCGRCMGCRLDSSKQWAIRCVHEASLHDANSFITLTFRDDILLTTRTLIKRDFQLFMKRLRKELSPLQVRYFHCGEYGEQLGRPHHHACKFGYDFPDRQIWQIRGGVPLYRSAQLERLWPYGYATVGDVTYESAAYVARYVCKKITGKPQGSFDPVQRHYQGRLPEYITMSRRPGIGRPWIDKFMADIYPRDEVVLSSKLKLRPPKYYDKLYDDIDPVEFGKIKQKRREHVVEKTSTDLKMLERSIKNKLTKRKKRNYENPDLLGV